MDDARWSRLEREAVRNGITVGKQLARIGGTIEEKEKLLHEFYDSKLNERLNYEDFDEALLRKKIKLEAVSGGGHDWIRNPAAAAAKEGDTRWLRSQTKVHKAVDKAIRQAVRQTLQELDPDLKDFPKIVVWKWAKPRASAYLEPDTPEYGLRMAQIERPRIDEIARQHGLPLSNGEGAVHAAKILARRWKLIPEDVEKGRITRLTRRSGITALVKIA